MNDGWTEIFRTILGSIRSSAPSKLRMFSWFLGGLFTKDLYQKGIKKYMMDKFINYVGEDNLMNKVEMVDFEKMENRRGGNKW